MVIFYGNLYVFISYCTERIFPFDEIYMFLFHMLESDSESDSVCFFLTGLIIVETTRSSSEKK